MSLAKNPLFWGLLGAAGTLVVVVIIVVVILVVKTTAASSSSSSTVTPTSIFPISGQQYYWEAVGSGKRLRDNGSEIILESGTGQTTDTFKFKFTKLADLTSTSARFAISTKQSNYTEGPGAIDVLGDWNVDSTQYDATDSTQNWDLHWISGDGATSGVYTISNVTSGDRYMQDATTFIDLVTPLTSASSFKWKFIKV